MTPPFLAIHSFAGRVRPAVLSWDGHSYTYHDDSAPGFIGADVSAWDAGWRLHVYAAGNLCRYIAQHDGESPVGTYVQANLSAYNVELGQPTVEIIASDAESAERAMDDAAASESATLRRAEIVRRVCMACGQQSGFPSHYKVRCAKSPASCGCVSLLRGVCPASRWVGPLLEADALSAADVREELTVEQMIDVIESGFRQWPAGWHRWENTQEAHRKLMMMEAARWTSTTANAAR